VIAVNVMNGFVEDRDFTGALFGSEAIAINTSTGETSSTRNRDGVWITTRGVASRRVSAVLAGISVIPENCATQELRLWQHFEPDQKLTIDLPFATARVIDGELICEPASRKPHEMLELPEDWPGSEPRFPR
jgi:hypothetical protein